MLLVVGYYHSYCHCNYSCHCHYESSVGSLEQSTRWSWWQPPRHPANLLSPSPSWAGIPEDSKVEGPAFTDAIRMYRQSKELYGTWEMLCGNEVQVRLGLGGGGGCGRQPRAWVGVGGGTEHTGQALVPSLQVWTKLRHQAQIQTGGG